MKKPMLLAGLGALLTTPTYAAPTITMSAAVKRDVQCFVLYSIAVNNAELSNDEKVKQAAALGVMYFLGKIKVGAPDLNLADAVRQEADAMDAAPPADPIGKDCDAEFQNRGAELINFGQQLQQSPPQSPSSS